jgi:hypothetical protein
MAVKQYAELHDVKIQLVLPFTNQGVLTMKTAVLIYSNPGSEEALGRCYSALAAAYESIEHGDDIIIIFGGAGVRWPAELSQSGHPAHSIYETVKHKVQGACSSCAAIYAAVDGVGEAGVDLIGGVNPPGSMGNGLPSIRRLMQEGYALLSY